MKIMRTDPQSLRDQCARSKTSELLRFMLDANHQQNFLLELHAHRVELGLQSAADVVALMATLMRTTEAELDARFPAPGALS